MNILKEGQPVIAKRHYGIIDEVYSYLEGDKPSYSIKYHNGMKLTNLICKAKDLKVISMKKFRNYQKKHGNSSFLC